MSESSLATRSSFAVARRGQPYMYGESEYGLSGDHLSPASSSARSSEISFVQQAYNDAVALVEKTSDVQVGYLAGSIEGRTYSGLSDKSSIAGSDPVQSPRSSRDGKSDQSTLEHEGQPESKQASRESKSNAFSADLVPQRLATIDASRLQQMQMLSDFLEVHFPTAEAKANLAYRKSVCGISQR